MVFIARVGRDLFGDQAIAGFVNDGIQVDHDVRDSATPSDVALILFLMMNRRTRGGRAGLLLI